MQLLRNPSVLNPGYAPAFVRYGHTWYQIYPSSILSFSCCFRKGWIYLTCKSGSHIVIYLYSGDLLLPFLPLPVSDPIHPWGEDNCTCNGTCSSHYLKPESNLVNFSGRYRILERGIPSACKILSHAHLVVTTPT